MKIAVVISVGRDPRALDRATATQALLLEHLSAHLNSIRLAVPRLVQAACLAAVAEEPDFLVFAGGARDARRAGQIAHLHGTPILFLPGFHPPVWARRLWGSLSLEEMVVALAREDVTPTPLGAGFAGEQIFFDNASYGLLPQLTLLSTEFADLERFSDAWQSFRWVAGLARALVRPRVRIECEAMDAARASTLVVTAQGFDAKAARSPPMPRLQTFSCTLWRHRGAAGYLKALLRAARGADWHVGGEPERFECGQLKIDGGATTWLLLDGDPLPFRGPIGFRFQPNTLETFAFSPDRAAAGASPGLRRSRFGGSFGAKRATQWNPRSSSHVDTDRNRSSAGGKERKQV
jgi:hypothetical protein